METLLQPFTVADPGFPRGGGANSQGGAPTYEFAKFSQKLHEIERIWTPGGGGGASLAPPLDPPLFQSLEVKFVTNLLDHEMAGQIDTYQLLLT